jgi:galactokinase
MASRARTVTVPGRVNLMGDHTDYNDGFALPMAVDRRCTVRITPNGEHLVRAVSEQLAGTVHVPLDKPVDPRAIEPAWGRFVAGAVAAVQAQGAPVRGCELHVASTVPAGSGLSSSSAFAVALVLALTPDADAGAVAQARLALDAEVRATGVPGGLMDQLVALLGRAGHALLIDFRSDATVAVPIAPNVAVLVAHCGRPRTLADTAYARRRAECEAVAAELGLVSLRDASAAQVADRPRARHVVAENARVQATADALREGDLHTLGHQFAESHASLRDDYEVSTPELDALTDAFVAAGAAGARLTGAGFGGCVVAVAGAERARSVLAGTAERYRDATGITTEPFAVRAVDGARNA